MSNFVQVSVVVTCYNYGHFLDGCIRSILAQTFDDFEIIVIDDGSTDDTPDVIAPFLHLPNLTYVRQANSGQAKAKNLGIELACGDYIAFLDADDLWERYKLEKQIKLFANPKVGVVYCRAKYIDESGKNLDYIPASKFLLPRSGKVTDWLFIDNFITFSSSVVRKKCFKKLNVFDENLEMGIDWDLWLRISTLYHFEYVNEKLLSYRMGHLGQMSTNAKKRQHCADNIMRNFLLNYSEILSKKTIRTAYSHTFCNRGNYYRKIDFKLSTLFFLKAIRKMPFHLTPYKGLMKNIIKIGS